MQNNTNQKLEIVMVAIEDTNPSPYNPRKWSDEAIATLTASIKEYGLVDPILLNSAPQRKNVVVGGHFRLKISKDLGYTKVPAVYIDIPDIEQEKKLNLLLNKAQGEWDWELLAKFDEALLTEAGFTSEELDSVFNIELDEPEQFDLDKELKKLNIDSIEAKKNDVYLLGDSRLMVGDSTIPEDFDKLMNGELADMCLTDEPYLLDYVHAKRGGKPVTGFGAKKNRRYLETDVLPDNFIELWMANVAKHAKPDFSIISYENWKNIRAMWAEMEKYWKVKNMIVWHLPNRHQGFSAKYKFFSKYDIAIVGGVGDVPYNHEIEPDGLQEEYETALYAIAGKPTWEGYEHGKRIQPTDFIDYQADDEKSSGQGIIFGTKPIEILVPYIKVLTKRGDLVVEPFGGSGSTLIASTKLKRRCYIMEKSPVYAEVIMKRWEKFTGLKREKVE
jgi:DNA modification methylase